MKRIVSYNDSLAFVAEIQSEVFRGQKYLQEEDEFKDAPGQVPKHTSAERAAHPFCTTTEGALPPAEFSEGPSSVDNKNAHHETSRNVPASPLASTVELTPPVGKATPGDDGNVVASALRTAGTEPAMSKQVAANESKEAVAAGDARSLDPREGHLSMWPLSWGIDACARSSTTPSLSSSEHSHERSAPEKRISSLLSAKALERSGVETSPPLGIESFPMGMGFEEQDSPEAYGGIRDAFIDRHRALPEQYHLPPTLDADNNLSGDSRWKEGGAVRSAPNPLSEPSAIARPELSTMPSSNEHQPSSRPAQTPVSETKVVESEPTGVGSKALSGGDSQSKRVYSALDLPEMATPAGQTKYMVRKLVIVMVGLPARGKSHIAQQVARYLNWLGHRTAIFNVGVMRRRLLKSSDCDASFFSPENEQGMRLRWEFARQTLNEMTQWLFDENGQVGIYDATNSTKTRRRFVREYLENLGIRVLFLESIVNDERIVEQNILATKLNSPDYRDRDAEYAVRDFKNRLMNYERANESITEDEGSSYVKIIDGGKKFVLYNLKGHLQSKIVSYLTSVHIIPRLIYLSRHGESEWNVTGQLGGDPPITRRGEAYAKRLSEFLQREFQGRSPPTVWCSQLRRTWLTVRHIPTDICICWRSLNEINAGTCEGMTYEQIKEELPDVWEARKADKLRYRYPGGESYLDVIHRVEPIILEIERQTKPLLIVAHNAIIRSIYAFFKGLKQEQVPYVDIPLHTLICLRTRPYGCDERRYKLLRDEVPLDRARTPEPSDSEGHPNAATSSPGSGCGVVERVWFDDTEAIP
jgi:broad specificity phosphatase PhoE/adenylylsulfate kinase-like enzyme